MGSLRSGPFPLFNFTPGHLLLSMKTQPPVCCCPYGRESATD
jgi:hypothetical protein